MSRPSASFIIETLEAVRDDLVERGDRFRPLTQDVERSLEALNSIESLNELLDDDDC